MSLFFVPTQHPFAVDRRHRAQQHHQYAHGGRCGSSMTAVQSPFDLVFGGHDAAHSLFEDDYDVIAEQRLRQHYAALRRQADAERERELRRRRIQQEQRRREAELAAAAAAWQAELERKQQRALAERRRREREIAAQHQRALERRLAAAAQQQWEQLAVHGIASAIELANRFFVALNDEDEEEVKSPANATPSNNDSSNTDVAKDTEMVSAPSEEAKADQSTANIEQNETQEAQTAASQDSSQLQTVKQQLVFSYPLPKDASQRATIKADDIQVDFDEQSRTIQIKGLWDVTDSNASESSSTISAQSDDEDSTRGRKRSRSPKRSRVSDVDEKTGEEIVKADEDGFVNISSTVVAGKQAQGTARVGVPDDADISALRAELTDDGFHLYL